MLNFFFKCSLSLFFGVISAYKAHQKVVNKLAMTADIPDNRPSLWPSADAYKPCKQTQNSQSAATTSGPVSDLTLLSIKLVHTFQVFDLNATQLFREKSIIKWDQESADRCMYRCREKRLHNLSSATPCYGTNIEMTSNGERLLSVYWSFIGRLCKIDKKYF